VENQIHKVVIPDEGVTMCLSMFFKEKGNINIDDYTIFTVSQFKQHASLLLLVIRN